MKLTLDEKVNQNTANIVDIKRDVDCIKQHAIKNEEDHKIMAQKVDELNSNVMKLMNTVMEKL
jgi:Mg2+ and Co2+ transporter CorA